MHASNSKTVELAARDLTPEGSIACPGPLSPLPAWASHPRIFLDVGHGMPAYCPYCGTTYRLKAGETFTGSH